ncbi:hypothetical protein [Curtobacterium sp. MCSS17_015]|uniref:hypothetical protein n=1 Tax=Curtobacterium sp. MCSS17_015 TaxID=2175666 RepID=UPI0011B6E255|nr:hypothetical protein [Curtobacterium sp. MCSS17_015]WIB25847.1 hypothetical protein DEJ18_12425 [Curtobacterium sp. MCSS17_015]
MKTQYRDGALAQAGDLVTSRWSSSGAIWRVVDLYVDKHERPCANLRSTMSNRIDTRRLRDLRVVIPDAMDA